MLDFPQQNETELRDLTMGVYQIPETELRDLTMGVYQIRQPKSYTKEHQMESDKCEKRDRTRWNPQSPNAFKAHQQQEIQLMDRLWIDHSISLSPITG